MYYDLYVPWPTPDAPVKKKKDKGKGKAPVEETKVDCWAGLSATDKARVASSISLSGHLGYNVVALTVAAEQSTQVLPCPFGTPESRQLPYPVLDPRFAATDVAGPSKATQPTLVQVTRYHMRLDDGKVHPITAANTTALRDYDLISAYVGCDKALQLACTDLANPGPNQLSIITVPLHERPFHFRLNRKQVKLAQRNGVVFEILYAAGLFPSRSTSAETARRYRQNWMTNARELVRITGGKGIIFSAGPGGSEESQRGPLDVVNLATILGVPANFAKDALSLTPKTVLLRAQARRTYKAVVSAPRIVSAPGEPESAARAAETAADVQPQQSRTDANGDVKMSPVKRKGEPADGAKKKKIKK